MSAISIPVITRALKNLSHVLAKAEAHAEARKIDPSVLLSGRLYPDMLPLTRQVQIASDLAKSCAARLAGREPPVYEDTETTFTELQARITRTLEYIQGVPAAEIDGAESRTVTVKLRELVTFPALTYLQYFVLPNVFFHCATAYAILRHNGVELGKGDFLGRP
jgi:hypothetical protein